MNAIKTTPVSKVPLTEIPAKKKVKIQIGAPEGIKCALGAIKRKNTWYILLRGTTDDIDWVEKPLKRVGKNIYYSYKGKNYIP